MPDNLVPGYIRKYAQGSPDGVSRIAIVPTSERCPEWADASLRFGREFHFSDWPEVHGRRWEIKNSRDLPQEVIDQSHLFTLGNAPAFCVERVGASVLGCPICADGRVLSTGGPLNLELRSILSWNLGLTSYGRIVCHEDLLHRMLSMGFTGFGHSRVQLSEDPFNARHVLSSWSGSLTRQQQLLSVFLSEAADRVQSFEWGSKIFVLVDPSEFSSNWFQTWMAMFRRWDRSDLTTLRHIAPSLGGGLDGYSRWAELSVTGFAGRETEFNDYIVEQGCPRCRRSLDTDGPVVLDESEWDGSDLCVTDAGRLCVSSRARDFLIGVHVDSEPVGPIGKKTVGGGRG